MEKDSSSYPHIVSLPMTHLREWLHQSTSWDTKDVQITDHGAEATSHSKSQHVQCVSTHNSAKMLTSSRPSAPSLCRLHFYISPLQAIWSYHPLSVIASLKVCIEFTVEENIELSWNYAVICYNLQIPCKMKSSVKALFLLWKQGISFFPSCQPFWSAKNLNRFSILCDKGYEGRYF